MIKQLTLLLVLTIISTLSPVVLPGEVLRFRLLFGDTFPDITLPNNLESGVINIADPTRIKEKQIEIKYEGLESLQAQLETYLGRGVKYKLEGRSFLFNGAAGAAIWSQSTNDFSVTPSPYGLTGYIETDLMGPKVNWLTSASCEDCQAFINDNRRYTRPVGGQDSSGLFSKALMKDRNLATVWNVAEGIPSSAQSIYVTETAMREVGDWPYVEGIRPGWFKIESGEGDEGTQVFRAIRESEALYEGLSPFDWDFPGYQGASVSSSELVLIRPSRALPYSVDLSIDLKLDSYSSASVIELYVIPELIESGSESWESVNESSGAYMVGHIKPDEVPTGRWFTFSTENSDDEDLDTRFREITLNGDFTFAVRVLNEDESPFVLGIDKFTIYKK